ncbi:MAG TPA: LamG domain-containing protein [Gemmataceae bacterium]|nr:LamG domain-containing protein [Gemmataceae bacterium]
MSDMQPTRRDVLKTAMGTGLASLLFGGRVWAAGKHPGHGPVKPPAQSAYREQVLSLKPAGYWRLDEKKGPKADDASGHGRDGEYKGSPKFSEDGALHGDPDHAVGLNGESYIEVPSSADFSIGADGLTVEAWVRPDRLNFPCAPHESYIHWLGKGEAGHYEWGFRFYKKDSNRPNRISAYAWNPEGSKGSGAYFEEAVEPGQWIHVVAVFQPPGDDAGVLIYRDGELKKGPPDAPTLYRSYDVTPTAGPAPLRLGTRDLDSFLRGGLDEIAIYPRCLTAEEIRKNYRIATGAGAKP